jgi:Cu(I)/Ag(I) efflux system membrane fusion protein
MKIKNIKEDNFKKMGLLQFRVCQLPFAYFLLPIAICLLLISLSCNSKKTNNAEITSTSKELYTCSMHPEILQDHPGNCPICGMKLIKKNVEPAAINDIKLETLLRPTNEFVVASLPLTTAEESEINIPINSYGIIEADTRVAGAVSARVSGRIEKLYLRYRFQNVAIGQKIMEIYSPEIVTAEENLLFLLKRDPDNTSFINAAKQKLLLLGMNAKELNKVIETRKVLYSVSVYSNYKGHVMDNGMNQNVVNNPAPETQELPLKEGMYVTKGQTLFNIMNHHKTRAALQIFPDDQPLIKKGDAVKIIPDMDTNAIINGRIDFIEPFFRGDNKTLTVRVYFDNKNMLSLGSQVKAKIFTGTKNGLWLPQKSVLTLGMNNVTFLKSNGGFVAHKITTGIRADNKVQILSGLNATDTVAANAQFLIDSESFIKTANGQ